MSKIRNLVKVGIFWGLIGGIMCSVYIIILAFAGVNPLGPLKYIYFSIYGLVFGLSLLRARKIAVSLHFLPALISCMALNLTASLVFFLVLFLFASYPISKPSMDRYRAELRKFMQDTKLNIIMTEGYNEFNRKYMIREGKIFRGRTEVDSTQETIEKYEGEMVFNANHRKRHEDFVSQIDKIRPLDIATDQTLGMSFVGFLFSFAFSLFFKNARIGLDNA